MSVRTARATRGFFDTSYLNSVPGWTVYAPTYYAELCSMLYQAIYVDPGAVAIRYPRGGEPNPPEGYQYEKEPFRILRRSGRQALPGDIRAAV